MKVLVVDREGKKHELTIVVAVNDVRDEGVESNGRKKFGVEFNVTIQQRVIA